MKRLSKEFPNSGREKLVGFYRSDDGLVEDFRGGDFVESYEKIVAESKKRYAKWIKWLQDYGVVASHPNDGWVNREEETFSLGYPHFNFGIEVDSQVALGDPESFRVVVVDRIDKKFFGGYTYHYTERPPICLTKMKS